MTTERHNVCFLGTFGCGKTSLIRRFLSTEFRGREPPTIGCMVHRPHVVTPAGDTTLYVYDTAGEERFMSLTQNFVRRADVVVVCYDTSNKESFKDLQEVWIPFVRTNVAVEPSVFIVGTKTDLPKCEVPVETAETYARNIRAHFLTTSALDNNNVNKLFEEIANHFSLQAVAPKATNVSRPLDDRRLRLG
ncbi:hypothetical protein BaRGS_00018448, partial [Batillaria attramentaria]